jgi:hypothetical protein
MKFATDAPPARWIVLVLAVLITPNSPAESNTVTAAPSAQNLAFVRYIGSLEGQDPLSAGKPVGVLVQATLPGLYKEAEMMAVRGTDESGRAAYNVLYLGGDGTVLNEVVTRYFELEQKLGDLPAPAVRISPANYKFHFRGSAKNEGAGAYIYDIVPRKNRCGLIKGQLWIDAEAGAEVLVTGRLVDGNRSIDVVRETTLFQGAPFARMTHLSFTIPILGRGELSIIEYLLGSENVPNNPMLPQTDNFGRSRGMQ